MDSLPDWARKDVDLSIPSAARMYDYFLGGAHNFAVDRELAAKVLAVYPGAQLLARANRAFLHRAVRYLGAHGIRQFIDIGSGIPTEGNVHETAQQTAPDSRVLYVDHDPVAVAHSELLLSGNPTTRVLQADLRRPGDLLDSPQLAEVIDLSEPVAVLMVAVLHFVPERDRPQEVITQFRDVVAPGSYLVLSHGTDEGRPDQGQRAREVYQAADDGIVSRSRADLRELFTGWEIVEPGVVWAPQWRPDSPNQVGDDPSASGVLAAIGRKD